VSGDPKDRTYFHIAYEEQQAYVQSLLAENERLRATLAGVESEKRQSDEQSRIAVAELRELRSRLQTVAAENEQFAERYQKIEIHNSNLANLYVASYQLHTTIDRDNVLTAIQEIVINLVGSEQVAIFEPRANGEFALSSAFGVDADRLKPFRLGDGPIGQRLSGGQIYVNPNAGASTDPITACIPLNIGPSVIGAILIFRLLDHKPALQPVDHEIFDLLAVHAASALYCATVREKLAGAN